MKKNAIKNTAERIVCGGQFHRGQSHVERRGEDLKDILQKTGHSYEKVYVDKDESMLSCIGT